MRHGRAHVVGAGLAGLSAAVALARAGLRVSVYEAAQQAGGRCRSYIDGELGRRIDNGNHLLVSGNDSAMAYIAAIGAAGTFNAFDVAVYPFLDLKTGERWSVRPSDGPIPWWIFLPSRSVAGARPWDYLEIARLRRAGAEAVVAGSLDATSLLYRRLWRPLCISALNTEPESASTALFRSVLRDTFGRGGAALRPVMPKIGLSESLVDPALALLGSKGADIRYGARLRSLAMEQDRVSALLFADLRIEIAIDDIVVLAVPAPVAKDLVPSVIAPDEFRAIVNAHYLFDTDRLDADLGAPFIGIIGGDVEWVFVKPGILSTTTSAATKLVDMPAEELRPRLWRDVAAAFRLDPAEIPPGRIVKERRATFAATPLQATRRAQPATAFKNLLLAGDWTDTGWPATIESAIRSGFRAASMALARYRQY